MLSSLFLVFLTLFAEAHPRADAADDVSRQRECAMRLAAEARKDHSSGKPSGFGSVVVENNRAFVNSVVGWFTHSHVRFYVVQGMLFAEDTELIPEPNTGGRPAFQVTSLGNYRLEWNSRGADAFVYYPATGVLIQRAPGFSNLGFGQNVAGLFYYGIFVRADAYTHVKQFLFTTQKNVAIPRGIVTAAGFRNGVPHLTYLPWR